MISVEVHSVEVRQLMRRIMAAGQKLPMRRLLVIADRSVKRNFHEDGRPEKWKPLSPLTPLNREKGGDRPLQDTGSLKKSIHGKVIGYGNLMVYTDHPFAVFHQEGTRPYRIRPKRAARLRFNVPGGMAFPKVVHHPGIPARPFLLWQDEDIKAITKVLADHLTKGLN